MYLMWHSVCSKLEKSEFFCKKLTVITESNFKVTAFQNANSINLTKSNKPTPKANKIIMK